MAGRGLHFALTDAEAAEFRAQPDDADRMLFMMHELEEVFLAWHPERVAATDRAWDAIHRALSGGGPDSPAPHYPLTHVVLGGERMYGGGDWIMVLKTPSEVRSAAAALRGLSRDELRRRYLGLASTAYGQPVGEDGWERTWERFQGLRAFWERAAAAGHHVLFTADR